MIKLIQDRMNKLKDALGLPRSISLFGAIQACPILVAIAAAVTVAILYGFVF